MAGLANDCGMVPDGIAAARLAVTDAATNAVIHAHAEAQGEPRVTAAIRDGERTIVIGDTGRGRVEQRDSPGLGAGLAMSRALRTPIALCGRAERQLMRGRVDEPGRPSATRTQAGTLTPEPAPGGQERSCAR
jgi:hypothetical protein